VYAAGSGLDCCAGGGASVAFRCLTGQGREDADDDGLPWREHYWLSSMSSCVRREQKPC
jgi:hypothetical protein